MRERGSEGARAGWTHPKLPLTMMEQRVGWEAGEASRERCLPRWLQARPVGGQVGTCVLPPGARPTLWTARPDSWLARPQGEHQGVLQRLHWAGSSHGHRLIRDTPPSSPELSHPGYLFLQRDRQAPHKE